MSDAPKLHDADEIESKELAHEYGVDSCKDLGRWFRYFVVGFPGKLETAFLRSRVASVSPMWLCMSICVLGVDVMVTPRLGKPDTEIPVQLKIVDVTCLVVALFNICTVGFFRQRVRAFFGRHILLQQVYIAFIILLHYGRILVTNYALDKWTDNRHMLSFWYLCVILNLRLFIARHTAVVLLFVLIPYVISMRCLPVATLNRVIEDWTNSFGWGCAVFLIAAVFHEYFMRKTFIIELRLRAEIKARCIAEQLALRQKEETLTTLAKMSHEVRTPLGCLLGLNDLMLNSKSEVERVGYAQNIQSSGAHLLQLLGDVLDYSTLTIGVMNLHESWHNPISLVKNCTDLFTSEFAKKRLALKLSICESFSGLMYCDSTRVAQICTNFLSNAIKFTPEEGRIEVSLDFLVDVLRPEGRIFEVRVTDTGGGMCTGHKDRLFEDFYQADSTRTRSAGGVGLGLSICSSLAKVMKGTVGVESVVNEGSSFWFSCFFPTSSSTTGESDTRNRGVPHQPSACSLHSIAESENTCTPVLPNFPTPRILLVDDTPMNIKIYSAQLQRWGCAVVTAHDGESAVASVKKEARNIDAVIMDVHMPGMDGLEASRILADLQPQIPTFGLTADSTVNENSTAYKASGMCYLFYKPLKRSDVSRIREMISLKAADNHQQQVVDVGLSDLSAADMV